MASGVGFKRPLGQAFPQAAGAESDYGDYGWGEAADPASAGNGSMAPCSKRLALDAAAAAGQAAAAAAEAMMAGVSPAQTIFNQMPGGREAYIQRHIHQKLWTQANQLGDDAVLELGKLSFNRQFTEIEIYAAAQPGAAQSQAGGSDASASDLWWGPGASHTAPEPIQRHPGCGWGSVPHQPQQQQQQQQQQGASDAWAVAATPAFSMADYFGGAGRQAYVEARIHRKLHTAIASLSDEEVFHIGQASFNQQFGLVESATGLPTQDAARAPNPVVSFGDRPIPMGAPVDLENTFLSLGREGFMQLRVHRRLHNAASSLSDPELVELGKMSFKDQFDFIETATGLPVREMGAPSGGGGGGGPPVDLESQFLTLGREAYMQARVHRRLHPRANIMDDQELMELGRLSFNEQFRRFEIMDDIAEDAFGGIGREAYLAARVHRKLHARCVWLSDQELKDLGQMNFNEQFGMMDTHEVTKGVPLQSETFDGMGRDLYLVKKVHRKLQEQASTLSDAELFELGQLSFSDQFHTLEVWRPGEGANASSDLFGGIGREAYIMRRVHRKLHEPASQLSDEGLAELGKLSFKEQFPMLGMDYAAATAVPGVTPPRKNLIVPQRPPWLPDPAAPVKKEASPAAEAMSYDDELEAAAWEALLTKQEGEGEAGQAPAQAEGYGGGGGGGDGYYGGPPSAGSDVFGGLTREQYLQTRVHRKLHMQASRLSDQKLYDFGQANFNQQFTMIENMTPEAFLDEHGGLGEWPPNPIFGGQTRDEFMIKHVHRRLHAECAALSDDELFALGGLSFHEQFKSLGHA